MTTTARLVKRLDRVVERLGAPAVACRVDLNRLPGADADRLVALGRAVLAGAAPPAEVEELQVLLTRSITLTSDVGIARPFVMPPCLQIYWRLQKFSDTGFSLPGGNYRFNALCFADRERMMDLNFNYGWEPEAEEVWIVPLEDWDRGDLEQLFGLLWRSTPGGERAMWWRRE